jgi:nicotinamidase-related amidase
MELNPTTTAVVAVHMQNDVVTESGAFGDFFAGQVAERDVVAVTGRLLDSARRAGATVVYTRVAFQPGHRDLVVNSPLLGMVAQTQCLVDGSDQAAVVDDLTPADGDVVVTHQRLGGFTDSTLDRLLRGRGIDTLVFAGVATNLSVEGTARQASDLGYRTVVVSDACSAADQATHDAALGTLGMLAEIVTSADVDQALSSPAAAPAAV